MGFKSVVIIVEDIKISRSLYENTLGLKVIEDHGEFNVGFESGFAIYQKKLFQEISGIEINGRDNPNSVLYFEYENIQQIQEEIELIGLTFLHKIREQPWGQLTFRVFDYDHHILEIAEDMNICIHRMNNQGMNIEEISRKVDFSKEKIIRILEEKK